MKSKLFIKIFILLITIFFSFSCTTYRDYSMVYEEIYNNDFDTAYEQLELEKNYIYSDKDEVLYSLDSGLLAHYSGDYNESNSKLSRAETLMEAFYSKSISQSINSFFTNDNAQDYAGDEYEDIYSNIFMALNYIHLGKTEDAFVEIRRFDNKQKALSVKYSEQIAYAKEHVGNLNYNVQFNNSAFARYISLLLYRANNQMDSAEVDRKKIEEAFKTQPNLYPFDIPLAVNEEFLIPANMARLNILGFAGLAPVKIEETIDTFSTDGIAFKLALPEMQKRGTKVDSISVVVYGESNDFYVESLEKIESIENIAYDTFAEKKALIHTKAFLRALSKTAVSTTLDVLDSSYLEENGELSAGLTLLSIASKVWIAASEFADIRTSQFFPAEVFVGGLTIPEGTYVVQVKFQDSRGRTLSEEIIKDVVVTKNNVNLVESLCVR